MNIKPESLEAHGYTQLDALGHKDLVPFIMAYMRKRTRYSLLYYACNVAAFGLAGFLFVQGYRHPDFSFGDRFSYFSMGLAGALALIPLHEYIHVLAYRSQGATDTSYDANLKKFYFMALADKFVANRKEFTVVALVPFVLITLMLISLLFFVNANWQLGISGTLLAHTAMCSGDFGLLSYFEWHKAKDVVTYDDVAAKISYFYARSHAGKP